ncbi:MAG: LacI family DNA-binding transcriptional regulator [Gaiellaceae bacterium]
MSETLPRPPRTIQDVADLAGVSIATVSRVLNGHPDVSTRTREGVLRVVREYGFSKNRAAGALSGGRTSLIGVAVPEVESTYFAGILSGAAEALYERDMRVVLCPTHHEHQREVVLLDRLMHGTTDGALLVLPYEEEDELETLLNHGYPFVVVEPRTQLGDNIACVTATHHAGAVLATRHLLELGHRRIGAILGPDDRLASQERLNGFRSTLATAGITPDPSLEVGSNFKFEGGEAAAAQLLDLPRPPTAIFAFNDEVAIGAMIAARARGLRIPGDVSIVGFDDALPARLATPPLTTVRQPLAELGRTAVSLLRRLINKQRVEVLRVELHTKLILRASTGPPRGRDSR